MASTTPAEPEANVSGDFPFEFNFVDVLDGKIAYVDTGSPSDCDTGFTHVFVHGNPTSSYTWRNVMPHVMPKARCVALDLIGMGSSSKPNISYRFHEHADYLEKFMEKVIPTGKVVFVSHDWGTPLAYDWAFNHQDRLAGFVLFEFVRPFSTWEDASKQDGGKGIKAFRSPETGRKLLIEQNAFIDKVLVNGVVRPLSETEMENYSRPFSQPSYREPVYRWPNEIPIEGQPADVNERLTKSHSWLLKADVPTLLFWADPGWVIREEQAQWYLKTLRNAKGVNVGKGLHYFNEDHPHRIGTEILNWVQKI
ncbi:Alpha/Beta hydrolase protein [Trichoderma chlorosporum]